MNKFYDESIVAFNNMEASYKKVGDDVAEFATSLGEKKPDFEEHFAFWREFMEEWQKNVERVEKMMKEEAKAKRAAAGGKKGKKPKKSAKSIRKKPKGKDKSRPTKTKRKLGKPKAVAGGIGGDEPDS